MQRKSLRYTGRATAAAIWLVVAASLVAGIPQAKAESLYTDIKASKVGDLLTIIVVESTQASRSASTQTSKSGSIGLRFDSGSDLTAYSGATSAQHQGDGTTKSSGALRTTVTATITEVLPNGDLKVEGKRELTINNEKEILSVSGVCRTVDVTSQNTVFSNQLASASIAYTGEGWIAKQQKPNIFLRILVGILPFI